MKITDIERRECLEQIEAVGIIKPLSYLPIPTIIAIYDRPIVSLMGDLYKQNLTPRLYPTSRETNISGGALFVYDPKMLGEVLRVNESELKRENIPVHSDGFVKWVATNIVAAETELFDVIADSFGYFDGPGRLHAGDPCRYHF